MSKSLGILLVLPLLFFGVVSPVGAMQVQVSANQGQTTPVHVAQPNGAAPVLRVNVQASVPLAGQAATLQAAPAPTNAPSPTIGPSVPSIPVVVTEQLVASPTALPTPTPVRSAPLVRPQQASLLAALWRFVVSLF